MADEHIEVGRSTNGRELARDIVTLRDYVDTMFAEKEKALQAALLAAEKAVTAALAASDKAINKAEVNAEKWRESANEWRGAMSDRDRELPSRREVETEFSAMRSELKTLSTYMSMNKGGSALVDRAWATVATVAAVVMAIVLILHG
jgi:dGTP triphosphohydrolase